jgi:hypothetical protein
LSAKGSIEVTCTAVVTDAAGGLRRFAGADAAEREHQPPFPSGLPCRRNDVATPAEIEVVVVVGGAGHHDLHPAGRPARGIPLDVDLDRLDAVDPDGGPQVEVAVVLSRRTRRSARR